jgi:hypothetical protein
MRIIVEKVNSVANASQINYTGLVLLISYVTKLVSSRCIELPMEMLVITLLTPTSLRPEFRPRRWRWRAVTET